MADDPYAVAFETPRDPYAPAFAPPPSVDPYAQAFTPAQQAVASRYLSPNALTALQAGQEPVSRYLTTPVTYQEPQAIIGGGGGPRTVPRWQYALERGLPEVVGALVAGGPQNLPGAVGAEALGTAQSEILRRLRARFAPVAEATAARTAAVGPTPALSRAAEPPSLLSMEGQPITRAQPLTAAQEAATQTTQAVTPQEVIAAQAPGETFAATHQRLITERTGVASAIPGETPVDRVLAAIKAAKPVRAVQEAGYSVERSKRLGQALSIGEQVPGQAGYFQQLGALKGALPKPQFQPLPIQQTDIDALFNQIEQHPQIGGFAKITAKTGLAKLFGVYGGQVPTEGELNLLQRVFGQEFVQTLQAKRGLLPNLLDNASQLIGIPRAIMASTDFSAPFRQGLVAGARYPRQFFRAFPDMFRSFGDARAYQALQDSVMARPTYPLMEEHGLALTGLQPVGLTGREEQFISNLAERIPLAGRLVAASNRAYTGFLTKLRADVFDDLLRRSKDAGIEQTPRFLDDMARWVNTATGRGDLGRFSLASNALSTAFFSPRLMASRLNMMNPLYYARLEPFARKEALKAALSLTAAGTTVLGLASQIPGVRVGADPRNADFGKIRIGNTRLDIWGSFAQYPRIMAQLITGKVISSTTGRVMTLGEGFRPLTRKDIAMRVLENKANPAVSFVLNWLEGKDFTGKPFSVGTELRNLVTPMVLQDLADLYNEHGLAGTPLIIPGVFGIGVQTYGPPKPPSYVP